MLDAYLDRHFLPQPNRYHPEMEMGLALLAVPAIAWVSSRLPRGIKLAVSAFFLCVAVEQIVSLRHFVELATRPVNVTQRIEYRIAMGGCAHARPASHGPRPSRSGSPPSATRRAWRLYSTT
jgi:hypothetical protein